MDLGYNRLKENFTALCFRKYNSFISEHEEPNVIGKKKKLKNYQLFQPNEALLILQVSSTCTG